MSIVRVAGIFFLILLSACVAPATSPWMDEVDRVGNERSKNLFPAEDGEAATGPNLVTGRTSEASRASEPARGPRLGNCSRRCSTSCIHAVVDPIGEARKPVYLVSHGWHTGIVVRRADLPAAVWPESEDFPGAEYLEVGWGDRDYYQTRQPDAWLTLKVALWPTSSVLHIAGFSGPVASYFPHSEVVELELSQRGFERLSGFVHDSFDRNGAARSARLGPGLYGQSAFYPARDKFHLFYNCNVWTARVLRAAGLPITPFNAITVDNVMSQARRFGKTIQSKPAGH